MNGNGQLQRLIEKLPPNAIEAEMCVLGSMLIAPECIAQVRHRIRRDDFYKPVNASIFQVMVDLYDRHHALDPVLLAAQLRDRGILDAVGGQDYLVELATQTPDAGNVLHYSRLVQEKTGLACAQACRDPVRTCPRRSR